MHFFFFSPMVCLYDLVFHFFIFSFFHTKIFKILKNEKNFIQKNRKKSKKKKKKNFFLQKITFFIFSYKNTKKQQKNVIFCMKFLNLRIFPKNNFIQLFYKLFFFCMKKSRKFPKISDFSFFFFFFPKIELDIVFFSVQVWESPYRVLSNI